MIEVTRKNLKGFLKGPGIYVLGVIVGDTEEAIKSTIERIEAEHWDKHTRFGYTYDGVMLDLQFKRPTIIVQEEFGLGLTMIEWPDTLNDKNISDALSKARFIWTAYEEKTGLLDICPPKEKKWPWLKIPKFPWFNHAPAHV